jgi:hypothetical protein
VIRWRTGTVISVRSQRPGVVAFTVETADGLIPAIGYPDVTGTPEPGERVLVNTTAMHLGLGTGGVAILAARLDAGDSDHPGPGHIVKARYTPTQVTVASVDEQDSPHHGVLADADSISGMPVVVADLHSALPAILCGVRTVNAAARVAYVMTDGGALPLPHSDTVAALNAAGWLTTTVTVGQAWGGALEAVTCHTGLLAARLVAAADLAVVTQGPGNLGTGTRWGFSGVASGEAINAAATLHGRPVAALRVSGADVRPRHQGLSHHSVTALGRVALHPADVAVPGLDGDLAQLGEEVRRAAAVLSPPHRLVDVATAGLLEALAASPAKLSTMGRDLDADPAAFLAAAAAGRHAATLISVG